MQELSPPARGHGTGAPCVGEAESPRRRPVTGKGSTLELGLRDQRPVICAVDSDEFAPGILATAAVLSAQLAVPLTVVHSPDPDIFLTGELRRAALERGRAFVDALTAGYTLDECVVEVDDPARLVLAVAEAGSSVIVMGTRGRTGRRSALMGSVSQTIVGSATCPVLAIPSAAARIVDDASGVDAQPLSPSFVPGDVIANGSAREPGGLTADSEPPLRRSRGPAVLSAPEP
jgi:nucleotide-binding universal stress UspA family protein